jgi:hypothetical protein
LGPPQKKCLRINAPADSPRTNPEIASCVAPVFTDLTRTKLKKPDPKNSAASFFTIDLDKPNEKH